MRIKRCFLTTKSKLHNFLALWRCDFVVHRYIRTLQQLLYTCKYMEASYIPCSNTEGICLIFTFIFRTKDIVRIYRSSHMADLDFAIGQGEIVKGKSHAYLCICIQFSLTRNIIILTFCFSVQVERINPNNVITLLHRHSVMHSSDSIPDLLKNGHGT